MFMVTDSQSQSVDLAINLGFQTWVKQPIYSIYFPSRTDGISNSTLQHPAVSYKIGYYTWNSLFPPVSSTISLSFPPSLPLSFLFFIWIEPHVVQYSLKLEICWGYPWTSHPSPSCCYCRYVALWLIYVVLELNLKVPLFLNKHSTKFAFKLLFLCLVL